MQKNSLVHSGLLVAFDINNKSLVLTKSCVHTQNKNWKKWESKKKQATQTTKKMVKTKRCDRKEMAKTVEKNSFVARIALNAMFCHANEANWNHSLVSLTTAFLYSFKCEHFFSCFSLAMFHRLLTANVLLANAHTNYELFSSHSQLHLEMIFFVVGLVDFKWK